MTISAFLNPKHAENIPFGHVERLKETQTTDVKITVIKWSVVLMEKFSGDQNKWFFKAMIFYKWEINEVNQKAIHWQFIY